MSIKILLADDSITIQKVICIIFGGNEYSLTIVDNGKAVLETARQSPPDILLIDALMPDMSGYEVCEQIRSTPGLSRKPILLLVGSFEPFDEEKAKKCGADDFIAKPFESQQIIAKVQELVRQGSSHSVAAPPVPEPATPVTPPAAAFAAAPQESAALDDIWGAFTAPAELLSPAPVPEAELDPFGIIEEEPEASLLTPKPTVAGFAAQFAPSPWTPVDENTFEFTNEPAAGLSPDSLTSTPPVEETSFGDISFEEPDDVAPVPFQTTPPAPTTSETAFTETAFSSLFAEPAPEPQPVEPQPEIIEASVVPAPDSMFSEIVSQTTQPAAIQETSGLRPSETATQLTEDQLKAALSNVSREVIERVVWEIVPDLAEQLISEAIKKIREGR